MIRKCYLLSLAFSTSVFNQRRPLPIQVVLDYKALEYFIITKALTARQVRQADILSQFNFLITYRLGTINRVDALIRRKQDLDNQIAAKILLRTQIRVELSINSSCAKIYPINPLGLNIINKLLQTNRIAPSLQEYRKKIKDVTSLQSLKNRLLKYQEWLVIAEEQNLRTRLIAKVYA